MFFLSKAKLPISDEKRQWADTSLKRLAELLSWDRMLKARVMLPIAEDFPDRYDRSDKALVTLFQRVAKQMKVDPNLIDLQMFEDIATMTMSLVPLWSGSRSAPGGIYREQPDAMNQIVVNRSQLEDPVSLIAVLAHEISHVILLGGGLLNREAEDMEPMTDLLTVFLGFGIFNANAAFQFRQYTNNQTQGWSAKRLGYLSEEMFGYALARFAFERDEIHPKWATYLATNVSVYFKRSIVWLRANGEPLRD